MVYTFGIVRAAEVSHGAGMKAETTERKTAKLFRNGRSQAVRLPKEFRFEGDEVTVRKMGAGVYLEPVVPGDRANEWAWLQEWREKHGPLDDDFVAAVQAGIAESRGEGRAPLKINDVEAWLQAIDALRGEPFMPEGRNQPEMPVRDIF
jgi:antitoxin VapB